MHGKSKSTYLHVPLTAVLRLYIIMLQWESSGDVTRMCSLLPRKPFEIWRENYCQTISLQNQKKTVHKGTIDKTFKSVRSLQILIILVNVSCYIIDLLHYWTLFGNKITGDSWKKACMCKMQEIWGKIFSVFMSHNNGTKLGVESMVNLWTVQAVRILHQWLIFCIGY